MDTKKEKLHSPVGGTIYVTGGWGPWVTPKPTGHRGYDVVGVGSNKYSNYACLDGKIVKPTTIPLYSKMPWMDDYGYTLKADSGEWILYNHCIKSKRYGQGVKKGEVIGHIDTTKRQRQLRKKWKVPSQGGTYGFTGRHLHWELITDRGDQNTDRVNPLYFQDRSVKLAGQYNKRQYTLPGGHPMPDLFITTKVVMNYEKLYTEAKKQLEVQEIKYQKDMGEKNKAIINLERKLETCIGEKEQYKKTNEGLNKQVTKLKQEARELEDDLKECRKNKPSGCNILSLLFRK